MDFQLKKLIKGDQNGGYEMERPIDDKIDLFVRKKFPSQTRNFRISRKNKTIRSGFPKQGG